MKKVEWLATLHFSSALPHSDNKRVCGSLRSPKLPHRTTSHTRQPLGETAAMNKRR